VTLDSCVEWRLPSLVQQLGVYSERSRGVCYVMWAHFVNVFIRILQGMPLLVSSNWASWLLGIAAFLLYEAFTLVRFGWEDMKKRWRQNLGMGLLVTTIVYTVLFAWSVVRTIYDEHHDSTSRWQAVVNEKNSLKAELKRRDDYIEQLKTIHSTAHSFKPHQLRQSKTY
jgi:hypothetical protein